MCTEEGRLRMIGVALLYKVRNSLESRDCVWGLAPDTLGAGRGRPPGVVTLPNLGREVGPRNSEMRNLSWGA